MCMEYKLNPEKKLDGIQVDTHAKATTLLLASTIIHATSATDQKFEQREVMMRAQTYLREGNFLPKSLQPALLQIYRKTLEV